MMSDYRFDIRFMKRFWFLCTKLHRSTLVIQLLLTLLLVRLLQEYVYYRVGLITSEYYKVLGDKDFRAFIWLTVKSLILFFVVSLVKSSSSYVASIFYVTCRKLLTKKLHEAYFRNQIFYDLNVLTNHIDNPDQRITQDTDKMCSTLSVVLPTLIISPFTIAYYTYISYSSTGWIGPTSVFVYFLLSTFVNKLLMSPVVAMVYLQEKLEGFFRYQHMHVRSNAEAIAFQNGQNIEHHQANVRLNELIDTQEKLLIRKYPLDSSVNLFSYFGSIISFLVLSVPIFTGLYDNLSSASLSALISKNTFVTMYLISCFTNLVSLSEDITTLAGTSHRVAQLLSYMERASEDAEKDKDMDQNNALNIASCGDFLLRVQELNISRPGQREQLWTKNVGFTTEKDKNVLIVGNSGIGKTSIFRVLKGLWKPVCGKYEFSLPSDSLKNVLFLSQKTILLPKASLRQQIMYPIMNDNYFNWTDAEITRYIDISDLGSLASRLKALVVDKSFLDLEPPWNWNDSLSPGEMQRVSFLRVFCHWPQLVFLDEALSAVSTDVAASLFNLCAELKITLVTIGHSETLKRYHEKLITLD